MRISLARVWKNAGQGLWSALGVLTTLPVPSQGWQPDRRAAGWFPVVGLLIGGLLAAAALLVGRLLPPLPAAVLLVALWAALTGALHLDGLADCADGLLPPVGRERRLEILRDPRVGSFGVTVTVLVLLLKVSSLVGAPLPVLLAAPVWARWLLLLAARRPAARSGGMAARWDLALTWPQLLAAGLLPLAVTAIGGGWHWPLWLAAPAAGFAGWGVLRLAERRLGGVTGDVFGAVVEISEAVFVCVACLQPFPGS